MLHSKFWQAFFALAPILIGVLSIGFWMYFVVNLITNIETAEASGGEVEASMTLSFYFQLFIELKK